MHSAFDHSAKRALVAQASIVAVTTCVFFLFSLVLRGIASFLVPFSVYWAALAAVLFFRAYRRGEALSPREIMGKSQSVAALAIGYVPALLVIAVTMLPQKGDFDARLFCIAVAVGVVNGFLEEAFWRGTVYTIENKAALLASVALFAVNHVGFLFLDITYQGGAVNLVGGPLIMGGLWLYAVKRGKSLKHAIIAHQIVNAFAFYSTFVNNGF